MGPSILVPVARHLKEQWRLGAGPLARRFKELKALTQLDRRAGLQEPWGRKTLHLLQMGAEWMS